MLFEKINDHTWNVRKNNNEIMKCPYCYTEMYGNDKDYEELYFDFISNNEDEDPDDIEDVIEEMFGEMVYTCINNQCNKFHHEFYTLRDEGYKVLRYNKNLKVYKLSEEELLQYK